MICKKCGAKIDDNASVCEFCGYVYDESVIDEVPQEPIEPTDATETVEIPDEETEAILDENDVKKNVQMERIRQEKQYRLEEIEKRRQNKKRKTRRNRILIAILSLLCIAAIALGAYYISSSSDGTEDIVIITPRPTTSATAAPVVSETPEVSATPEAPVTPTRAAESEKPISTVKPVAKKKPGATSKATPKPTVKPVAKPTAKPVSKPASAYNDVLAKTNGAYIFPSSSTTLLSDAQVKGLSKNELRIARNEIYARHGRGFSNKAIQAYFNACSWYKIDNAYDYANEYANLSDIEKANVKLIKAYETK